LTTCQRLGIKMKEFIIKRLPERGCIIVDQMKKINGRLGPAPERVYATKEGKPFKCEKCGAIHRIVDVEFGEQYKCEACRGNLVEG
jgi:hypothetical protein